VSSLTEDLEFVDLTDFSPGIQSDILPMTPSALGAARIEDTWGCVALPSGGLGPAPRYSLYVDQNITYDYDGSSTAIPDNVQDKSVARIHDMVVHQETFYKPFETDDTGMVTNSADTVIVVAERLVYRPGPAATYSNVFAVLHTRNDPTMTTYLDSERLTFPIEGGLSHNFGTANIVLARGAYDEVGGYDLEFPPHLFVVIHASFLDGNISGGQWVDNSVIYPDPGDVPAGYTDTTVNPIGFQVGAQGATRVTYHQGRLVYSVPTAQRQILGAQPYRDQIRHISEGDDTLSDEQIGFLNVFDLRNAEFGSVSIIDSGKPDMIGVLHSVNTNELYVVKAQGGGVIVRDALERPTVARYPGVESTGYYPHKPVMVPGLGLVYGTRNGIFAWAGGNQSKSLSPGLFGKFWLTPWNADRGHTQDGDYYMTRHPSTGCGRFTYLYPYIYAPNNWIMDTRTGGWFRLFPTSEQTNWGVDLAYFDAGSSGLVYATRDHQAYGTDNLLYIGFNPEMGSSDWQWHSQPIALTLHSRVLEYREVQMLLSGSGSIDVTLIGNGGTEQTCTFQVNSPDRPVLVRRNYKVDAYDVEVKMTATGADDDTPAPTVHRMALGHVALEKNKRASRGGLTGVS
jgi:hypothetical protein